MIFSQAPPPQLESVHKTHREEEEKRLETFKFSKGMEEIVVEVYEKVNCTFSRDGTFKGIEVNGEIFIVVQDPSKTKVAIRLNHENSKVFGLKISPAFDRKLWTEKSIIAPKDELKPHTRMPSVKYKYTSSDPSDQPFNFSNWFTSGTLTMELEPNPDASRLRGLKNVSVLIPFGSMDQVPTIASCENSEYEIDKQSSVILWKVSSVFEENADNATIEINLPKSITEDDIFPLGVKIEESNLSFYNISGVEVKEIGPDEKLVTHELKRVMVSDDFKVV